MLLGIVGRFTKSNDHPNSGSVSRGGLRFLGVPLVDNQIWVRIWGPQFFDAALGIPDGQMIPIKAKEPLEALALPVALLQ